MKHKPFEASDPLRMLVRENPLLLMLIRRFGISLGFGNDTVEEVCARAGTDTSTFLAVANFSSAREWQHHALSLSALMTYLKNAHDYFMGFALPAIRRKLIEALPVADPKSVSMLLLKYFDDYAAEVREHITFENKFLFPYIQGLLDGCPGRSFGIAEFEARHASLTPKLLELKEIFVSHYQPEGNEELLMSALYDIITCEQDLNLHCAIEDQLLVPVAEKLEPQLKPSINNEEKTPEESAVQELTAREREIVRHIARGMSTKEIADALFLSAHTVNTHRRNICAKLDIHSAPALTIYAIIHRLIDISEIRQ